MLEVSDAVTIRRPTQELFEIAADPETQLKWDPAALQRVEKLTTGPLGPGARYRGKFKGMGSVDYEFVEFEPGRRFSHDAVVSLGRVHHIFHFEPAPEGCRLTQTIRFEPRSGARLLAPLMKAMFRRRMHVINTELKEYAERP